MKAELTGMKEAIANLDRLDKAMERKIIRKGLRAGGQVLKSASQGEAPSWSGRTKRNIKVRAGKRSKDKTTITVGVSAKDYAGEAFYASFVLYGHRVGRRALGDARKMVPANDFLKRAFDESSDEAAQTTIDAWKQLTDEELKAGGGK
jgi:HK97 gp10 family phage protein